MLSIFNGLRDINTATILFRMVLAMILGGLIGIERSMKNRPAGFRTHILIIIGATTASLTGHYIYLIMNLPTDMSRLGAQVITGLGFIGAGFYEGALAGTIAILFCETVMGRFRFRRYKTFHCVINYRHKDTLDHILRHCKDLHFAIKGLQIEGEADDSGEKVYSAFVALRPYKEIDYDAFIREVEGFDGVINAFVR